MLAFAGAPFTVASYLIEGRPSRTYEHTKALMYMDPGHCCVRVELPTGPYYADVGYAAPIYRAYPLFESFSLDSSRFPHHSRAARNR